MNAAANTTTTTTPSAGAAAIELRGVEIHFGEGKTAVQAVTGLDLRVASGELSVDGHSVHSPGADRGVVFQHHTLFPWKTVLKNVEFGLKMRGASRTERREAAQAILTTVGLGEFLDHYPWQLSGGMQQRVSLARVLVNRPRVTLMDEPFCALDAQTRLQMQELLLSLWHEYHITVVFVTHDVDEALFLSDRVVVLTERPGRVKAEIAVPLPRPRTRDLLTSPEFMGLKRRVLELLFDTPSKTQPERAAPNVTLPAGRISPSRGRDGDFAERASPLG